MAYYYLKGIDERRWVYILVSSVVMGLACMVKIPYVFIWILPLGYFTIRQKAIPWILKWSIFYIIPLIAFVLWQKHAFLINNSSPDLSYILGYHKMLPSPGWYFGTLAQRLALYSWWILLNRGIFEIVGAGGLIYFMISVLHSKATRPFIFLIYWFLGLILYVMIFFNLNLVHNYYQIPFLAPIAVFWPLGLNKYKLLM
ncbi:MAG: hypothetical protein IPI77_19370 [Saprospiraceae bacterium]|nr:hypothetical protein [Saprospiraceae bacterium]